MTNHITQPYITIGEGNQKHKRGEKMKHYVLVHGGCHGAWCWYKVKPVLEASGHRVTAVELTASGINMSKVEEIQSLKDYAKPLLDVLESFGSEDKAILVGHSLGGFSVALAADMFPSKVSAAVFVTSFMPDTTNPPLYVFEKCRESAPEEDKMNIEFGTYGTHDRPLTSMLLGTNFLAKKLYQLSPIEDFELAKMLVRVCPAATSILTGTKSFTKEGYGSVTRVYIICREDIGLTEVIQQWMIDNFPPKEVMEIKDADHMPMFSKPLELCDRLLKIADKYA